MNNIKKFENFLESLKGKGQDELIETVKQGFQTCYENMDMFPPGVNPPVRNNLSPEQLEDSERRIQDIRPLTDTLSKINAKTKILYYVLHKKLPNIEEQQVADLLKTLGHASDMIDSLVREWNTQ